MGVTRSCRQFVMGVTPIDRLFIISRGGVGGGLVVFALPPCHTHPQNISSPLDVSSHLNIVSLLCSIKKIKKKSFFMPSSLSNYIRSAPFEPPVLNKIFQFVPPPTPQKIVTSFSDNKLSSTFFTELYTDVTDLLNS